LAACLPPLDVEELPPEDGVLYGGGERDGKSKGSPAMYVRSTSSMGPECPWLLFELLGGDLSAMLTLLINDFPIFGEAGSDAESSQRDGRDENVVIAGGIIIIEEPGASPGELTVPLQCPGLAL